MAVIDSLVVKLGLDSSGFNDGKKKVESGLDQTRKNTEKIGKQIQESGKNAAEFFGQMRRSALLFFGALTGAKGLSSFVSDTVKMGAGLDRTSKLLGISANTLSKWGSAVKIQGGNAEGFMSTMQGLSQQLTEMALTGKSAMTPWLNMLGVSIHDAEGRLKTVDKLTEDIARAFEKNPRMSNADKFNILGQMGIQDEGLIRLMLMTEKERTKLISEQAGMSDAQAKRMREIDERWTAIKEKYSAMARDIMDKLLPSVERITDSLIKGVDYVTPYIVKFVDGFSRLNEYSNGWLTNILAGAAAIKGVSMLLPGLGAGAAAGAAGGLGAAGLLGVGASGAAGYAVGSIINDKFITGTKFGDWMGEKVAQGMAFFGSKEAQAALDANKNGLMPKASPPAASTKSKSGKDLPENIKRDIASAERNAGLPEGLLLSVAKQETGFRKEFVDDPAKYHYEKDEFGRRKSSAFGLFGILDSTANKPGYGVSALQDKSMSEQIRFASEYLAARIKYANGDVMKGLAQYGEGTKYAQQVAGRVPSLTPNYQGVMSGVSGSGATSSSQVNQFTVGSVTIQTQATDATGIARDFKGAMLRQADSSVR